MAEPIANRSVGSMVIENPAVARVFEKFGIDYCCQGRRSLASACAQRGLNLQDIIAQLDVVRRAAPAEWQGLGPAELADQIESVHHGYLKAEFPRIAELFGKVIAAHGQRHPELREAEQVFRELRAELESHMLKEERILFPMVRSLASGSNPTAHCGSVNNPIRVMEHEHDIAGAALRNLRAITGEYRPPADACPTFRVLYDALRELESDLHLHIHKENNVLFPRATELESQLQLVINERKKDNSGISGTPIAS